MAFLTVPVRGLEEGRNILTCLPFGRIVSDTSWDVSPRTFIATAAVAGFFWIAFLVALWRMRASILITAGRPRG